MIIFITQNTPCYGLGYVNHFSLLLGYGSIICPGKSCSLPANGGVKPMSVLLIVCSLFTAASLDSVRLRGLSSVQQLLLTFLLLLGLLALSVALERRRMSELLVNSSAEIDDVEDSGRLLVSLNVCLKPTTSRLSMKRITCRYRRSR